jgi:hypothetical protein
MTTGLREHPVFQDRRSSITANFVVVYSDDYVRKTNKEVRGAQVLTYRNGR